MSYFLPHLYIHPFPKHHHLLPDDRDNFLTGFPVSIPILYYLFLMQQLDNLLNINQINAFQRLLESGKIKPEIFAMAYKAFSELASNYLSVILSLSFFLLPTALCDDGDQTHWFS